MAYEQALRRAIIKVELDMRYESNDRFMINTHGFRALELPKSQDMILILQRRCRTKGYLLQYDRIDDVEKLEIYQKYEMDLLIDKDVISIAEIQKLKKENNDLHDMNAEDQRKAIFDIIKNLPKEKIEKLVNL